MTLRSELRCLHKPALRSIAVKCICMRVLMVPAYILALPLIVVLVVGWLARELDDICYTIEQSWFGDLYAAPVRHIHSYREALYRRAQKIRKQDQDNGKVQDTD